MPAAKSKKKPFVKFQCGECKNINYFLHKSRRAMEEKLAMKKFCSHCRKHTEHKEAKK